MRDKIYKNSDMCDLPIYYAKNFSLRHSVPSRNLRAGVLPFLEVELPYESVCPWRVGSYASMLLSEHLFWLVG